MTSAKLDATGQRWASALSQYSFDLIYRSGLQNVDADSMSRYPQAIQTHDEGKTLMISHEEVQAICSSIVPPYVKTLPVNNVNLLEITEEYGQPMAQIEMRELRREQRSGPLIDKWRIATIDKKMPLHVFGKEDVQMKRNFEKFKMKRGILYRCVQETEQLVVPPNYREDVLKGLHNEIGHPGKERTLTLLRERFFWPGMTVEAEKWANECERCLRRKSKVNNKATLVNITSTYPLERVCIDFLTLEPSKGWVTNILVMTDHFTKYAIAVPTKNQTAKTTAEAVVNNLILNYGIPTYIHSDQGPNFESDLIKELCELTKIKKSRTTPYYPMGNGITERFNRTLLNMLGTLDNEQKADWKKNVSFLVYAYNCIPHESTKFSPFELMFGRKPRLPVDVAFGEFISQGNAAESTSEYIMELNETMRTTQQIAKEHTEKAQLKQKGNYDKKAKAANLEVGDQVLVRILAHKGKHKIADKFEEELYTVVKHENDIPVYRLKGNESGRLRSLHRNHLFLVGHQEITEDEVEENSTLVSEDNSDSLEEVKVNIEETEKANSEEMSDSTEDDSEDEEEEQLVVITSSKEGSVVSNEEINVDGGEVVPPATEDGGMDDDIGGPSDEDDSGCDPVPNPLRHSNRIKRKPQKFND